MPTRLDIFPYGGLGHSVVTTVAVGVFVLAFLNLRLGWPLSGLVVPGYLVPLLLANPWAGGATILEGVVLYGLLWLVSDRLSRFGLWSRFFGRDLFFALVVGSVFVRAFFDGWLLPYLGGLAAGRYHLQLDYHNDLHSFGLIVVALIANQFRITGLWRGLWIQTVTTGLTLCVVRFVLMEHTNFSLVRLEYMYEDIAQSFLAAPKSYIIVIFTAYVASRVNLMYGWDFHGILIPALLALLWHNPMKILATFIEAYVVLVVASLLLSSRLFRGVTMERARKILLFFTVAFAYKMVVSHAVASWIPVGRATDYLGFGYLLCTLMAIKMHDLEMVVPFTRAILQCSFVAALAANVLGFSLTMLPRPGAPLAGGDDQPHDVPEKRLDMRLLDRVRTDASRFVGRRRADSVRPPSPAELELFRAGLERLMVHLAHADTGALEEARRLVERVDYRIEVLEGRYYYLSERPPGRGWGFYVIDCTRPRGLVIEVPAAADERLVLDVGVVLFEPLRAWALAAAGACRKASRNGSADVLVHERSMFQVFHRVAARRNVLQLRAQETEGPPARMLAGPEEPRAGEAGAGTRLWVKRELPPGLDLSSLEAILGDFGIEWGARDGPNLQRDTTPSGVAELVLTRRDRQRILLGRGAPGRVAGQPGSGSGSGVLHDQASLPGPGVGRSASAPRTMPRGSVAERAGLLLAPEEHPQRVGGFLMGKLARAKGPGEGAVRGPRPTPEAIAGTGSDAYVVPTQGQLLSLDEEVLVPLLRAVRTDHGSSRLTPRGLEELSIASDKAKQLGYEIRCYRESPDGRDHVLLEERSDPGPRKFWGTYVFRVGPGAPYLVQIPRPLFELYSLEYGVALFEKLDAAYLTIAGASPKANVDGSADVLDPKHRASMFGLVSQVILRELGQKSLMLVQARGFGVKPDRFPPRADVVLALGDGGTSPRTLSFLGRELYRTLEAQRMTIQFVDGTPATAGLEATSVAHDMYLSRGQAKEFGILWLSPRWRTAFRQPSDDLAQAAQFEALGLASTEVGLHDRILQAGTAPASVALPAQLRELLELYATRQDIMALSAVVGRWSTFKFERVIDPDSRQAFLLFQTQPARYPAVFHLWPLPGQQSVTTIMPKPTRAGVDAYIDSRTGWLEVR